MGREERDVSIMMIEGVYVGGDCRLDVRVLHRSPFLAFGMTCWLS